MAGISANTRENMLIWMGNIGGEVQPTGFNIQWHDNDPGTSGSGNVSLALPDRDILPGAIKWAIGTIDDGVIENSTASESALAVATGTISYFSVWSDVTAGTYYFSGPLAANKDIASGDKLTWASGDLTVTLT